VPTSLRTTEDILKAHAVLPENVVSRNFVAETVVLNLNSGKYHGLNPTGGHMLEVLTKNDSVEQAAKVLADEYGRPLEQIQSDLTAFCIGLEERGLISLNGAS
jgi:hypothetical protein